MNTGPLPRPWHSIWVTSGSKQLGGNPSLPNQYLAGFGDHLIIKSFSLLFLCPTPVNITERVSFIYLHILRQVIKQLDFPYITVPLNKKKKKNVPGKEGRPFTPHTWPGFGVMSKGSTQVHLDQFYILFKKHSKSCLKTGSVFEREKWPETEATMLYSHFNLAYRDTVKCYCSSFSCVRFTRATLKKKTERL